MQLSFLIANVVLVLKGTYTFINLHINVLGKKLNLQLFSRVAKKPKLSP